MSKNHLGIFGGTFDPPHIGHLILAGEARYQLRLDRLLWVLTPNPPHKQHQYITPLERRLEMVQAVLTDAPDFELSRVDIDRPGPHYTLDMVRLLRDRHPGAELAYLMGGDSLTDLHTWHRPVDFVAACDRLGVMRRPGEDIDLAAIEARVPGVSDKVRFIDAPLLEIASSEIRERIAEGAPFRYYLPAVVYDIIESANLYRG